ncbi:MAG: hypothetical protein HY898_13570 [Deltaproteobacteria bacterium]|nr:hypothetical protein [Deltaproteobacteria bacterium]
MRPLLRHLTGCIALSLLAMPIACSGGGGGDTSYKEPNTSLAYYNNPANPRPAETDYITVTNVIITSVDEFDETNTGAVGNLYVQDVGTDVQPYSGITVYNPSFIPPDLKIFVGDVVDIRSPYMEFAGPSTSPFQGGATLPELSGANVKFRFESPAAPIPKLITPDDLYDYASGRKWLGVYVEMRDVTLYSDLEDDGKGRFSARLALADMAGKQLAMYPKVANSLCNFNDYAATMKKGTKWNIKGIVQYFFNFSITPRSKDEIQPAQ